MDSRIRAGLLLSVALAIAASACGAPAMPVTPTPSAPSPSAPSGSPTSSPDRPRPVVIDVDLDASDVLAVAILVRDPALDVRAVTVSGTGVIHCAPGLRLGRAVLDALGRPDVPVTCGRETAGGSARPFPDAWREAADRAWGMDLADAAQEEDAGPAAQLIARVAAASELPITIFAAGPLTNVADALELDPTLAASIDGIHAMGGVVDALGNVVVDDLGPADRLEWNFVADPASVGAVFRSTVPIALVPLDATDDVPVPADLLAWLEEDHAAAGADLAYELLLRLPGRVTDAGSQLWDELAALTVSRPDLVTWETMTLSATTVGPTAGRIAPDAAGRTVQVAVAADRPSVEVALLEALRRGAPRPQPFAIAGEARIVWDGSTCAWEGVPPSRRGLHRLTFADRTTSEAGGFVVGVAAPGTWSDLLGFLATVDLETEVQVPDWIEPLGELSDAATGSVALVDLPAGVSGVVCVAGTWPDLVFVPAPPVSLVP